MHGGRRHRLVCAVGTLGPTGQATITLVTKVGANIAAGSATNTGTVSSSTPDPTSSNNNASAPVTITTAADLAVTKTAATSPVIAGTSETYTITVTNNGPSDAQDVTVTDPVVAGLTARSANSTQGSCTITAGVVSCAVGSLTATGSVRVTVIADVAADRAAGPLANSTTVGSATTDPTPDNNTATATVTVGTSADVALTKVATPATIVFGQPVTYTLTARNNGPSSATGVVVSDPLPAGLTFASSASGCTAGAGVVTCPIGTLANGAAGSASFIVNTPAGGSGTVTNTAAVSATTSDPTPGNNSASAVSTTSTQADVSITKTAPANPVAGSPLTYSLVVTNNGPSAAAGVVVGDAVPAGITPTSASGPGVTCTITGQNVSCPVGLLANAGSITITVAGTVAATALGTSTNTATVTSSTTDPTPGNNSSVRPAASSRRPTSAWCSRLPPGRPRRWPQAAWSTTRSR